MGKGSAAVGELRVCLLGSPRIFTDGEEKILRERKAIGLLAYLAVERGVQSRDMLATLFWPEHDQQRARANLRYLLWSLRKELGAEWLIAEGDQIVLASGEGVRVDVAEFRRHLDRWRAHTHPADKFCAECTAALEAAAHLYRGDFLQGFSLDDSPQFDDWQFFQAEELRRELAAGLEALTEQEIARRNYDAAIGYARRWLTLDPLHEPAHRALMKLYAWADQYEAAIRQYHRCALALQEEMGVEPDPETNELYAQIRNRRFPLPFQTESNAFSDETQAAAVLPKAIGNLPMSAIAFVGRQTELAQIAARLADPAARLLTIVGPGGMGKSSLALRAGREVAGDFSDGVWFVSLAGLESPEQMPIVILNALEAPTEGSASPHQQLLRYLRDRKCLLIVDNFEDVLSGADLLGEVLRACSGVKLLVTSRERLNLREEWLLSLGSLDFPANGAAVDAPERYSALQLFALSAQRTQPGFALDRTNLPTVVRICQLVEGMPLALEMAAAWVRVLPVDAILGEIGRNLGFLSTPARNVETRHRSIHAVFDHSWQLLTERERSVLRQLSVFRNSFSREGAEAVAGASLLDLSALLDRSWIRLDSDGRYRMHALAQQYALEQLRSEKAEMEADVLQRHTFFFSGLSPLEALFGEARRPFSVMDVENVILAWQTALQQRHWTALNRIASAIYFIMDTWGPLTTLPDIEKTVSQADRELLSIASEDEESRELIETALARFLYVAGEHYIHLGNLRYAIDYLSRGRSLLEKYRNADRTVNVVFTHITVVLGFAFYYAGQFDRAGRYVREALTVFEATANERGAATTRLFLALISDRVGRYQDAERHLQAMGPPQEELSRWDPIRLGTLGRVYFRQGRYKEAETLLRDGYTRGAPRYQSHTLITLGAVARAKGNAVESQELLLRGLVIAEEMGDRPAQADLLAELGFTALQLSAMEAAQDYFARSYAIAEEIGRRRTVPLALSGLGRTALQKGDSENARRHLAQALVSAAEVNAPPDLLEVLVGVAAYYETEGKGDAASDLLTLVAEHPATTHETRTHAQAMLQSQGQEAVVATERMTNEEAQRRLGEAVQATVEWLSNVGA